MKILTILGTKPQFIKAGFGSRETVWLIDSYPNPKLNNDFNVDLYVGGATSQKIIQKLSGWE